MAIVFYLGSNVATSSAGGLNMENHSSWKVPLQDHHKDYMQDLHSPLGKESHDEQTALVNDLFQEASRWKRKLNPSPSPQNRAIVKKFSVQFDNKPVRTATVDSRPEKQTTHSTKHTLGKDKIQLILERIEENHHRVRVNKNPEKGVEQKPHSVPQLPSAKKEQAQIESYAYHASATIEKKQQTVAAKHTSTTTTTSSSSTNDNDNNKINSTDPSILKLQQLGMSLDEDEQDEIPPWSQITSIYGEEPVILGMETCEEYRNKVPRPQDRLVAPAGNL